MTHALVHLCRHGQVENPQHVLYGRLPDYHLSDLGRRMADRLGEYFTGRDLTHLRVSPLERAQETMAPIAAAHGHLPVVTDEGVIEAWNHLQGHVLNGVDSDLRDPRLWHYLVNPFRPSWGEPYVEQVSRMSSAIRAAAEAADGHEAVIVSHQLPIWMARRSAEGHSLVHNPMRRQCTLASVTTFEVSDEGIRFAGYDEPCRDLLPATKRKGFVAGA
ncbi:histidine phosphatase family protein [Raineyella fluvialis]|uniref:Histidine phosphatase family protein n=1 Tax=Raineyella fluvialis TaxID=2662261 RepID=A0A5Q2FB62_9ACTN|nr:histidine phosphatase family protein [Raineyella fluvialis]QGF23958.1 histidine phosphatase family protein [Raineyella fluvialis]